MPPTLFQQPESSTSSSSSSTATDIDKSGQHLPQRLGAMENKLAAFRRMLEEEKKYCLTLESKAAVLPQEKKDLIIL